MGDPEPYNPSPRPTRVRYLVVAATALVAVFMYIDRACLSQLQGDVKADLGLTDRQMRFVLGSFFLAYALFQVPAGWLGTKVGFRVALTLYLVLWSAFTGLTGVAFGLGMLLLARLAVGAFEAGAYPMAASLVKGWFPLSSRGKASGGVALGGRLGWFVSQAATPLLVLAFAAVGFSAWRGVLILYGALGIAMAAVFWAVVRDSAREHPWSNRAEADLVGPSPPPTASDPASEPASIDPPPQAVDQRPFLLIDLVSHSRLWLFSLTQFCVNIGWAFLITNLPEFLRAKGASPTETGFMSAIPAALSLIGMIAGGFVTDALVKRFGLRWGRALPVSVTLFFCAGCYAMCPLLPGAWFVVVALALMAMSVDVGIPSLWAYAQDVGGRNAGPALGWGNMWGNLGAFVSPMLLGEVKDYFGWGTVFAVCAGTFVVGAVSALGLDARRVMAGH